MNYVFLVSGTLLLLAAVADLIYTTFSPFGGGKIANMISKGTWKLALQLCGHDGNKKALQVVGLFAIVLIIMVWFLMVWVGSFLIFSSDPNAIVHAETKLPANLTQTFYYTGFTLSTLGLGDFVASTDTWRLFSVTLSLAGFMLITIAISYMLPVLSADVQKKTLSRYIGSLGRSPEEILKNHWVNDNFSTLEPHLTELMQMITLHSQQLLAYPILYTFHTSDRLRSTTINIASLDEALSILMIQIPPDVRPNSKTLMPLRQLITEYLLTQKNHFLKEEEARFSVPELNELREEGIPLLPRDNGIAAKYQKLDKRRKLIGAMLKNEGWAFADIYRGSAPAASDWDLAQEKL